MSALPGQLLGTYTRHPIVFARGEGAWLIDGDGKRYLDLLAGIAVCSLGHAHPALVEALQAQAAELLHVSNLFYTASGLGAAQAIVDRLGPGKVFFANSGAEANEAAIKLARKRSWRAGEQDRIEIVAVDGSFHGRTLGSLAATMQPWKWEGFAPLPAGFVRIEAGSIDALDRLVGERTAAVLLEPIQGEAGVVPLDEEFVRAAERLAHERGALLVVDEVQTGMGRTGAWWGFEHYGVRPDAVTLAKGLGGGVPVGALWVAEEHAAALGAGDHASTFGGNPLAAKAVETVFDVIERERLVERARDVGATLRAAVAPLGVEVRGRGLLLAVELGRPAAAAVVREALELGVVVNDVTPTALRLAPPLVLSQEEALEGAERLARAVKVVG